MGVYFVLLALGVFAAAYFSGRMKGIALRGHGVRVHSLPQYHGGYVAIATALPVLALFLIWQPIATRLIDSALLAELPAAMQPAGDLARASVLREIASVGSEPRRGRECFAGSSGCCR